MLVTLAISSGEISIISLKPFKRSAISLQLNAILFSILKNVINILLQKLAEEKNLTKIGIEELVAAGLTNGKELVKILGNGELKAKIDVEANAFSKTAEEAIKAVGGNATKI